MARKPAKSVRKSTVTNSKGNQKALKSPQFSTNHSKVRTGRRYGPGMAPSKPHN